MNFASVACAGLLFCMAGLFGCNDVVPAADLVVTAPVAGAVLKAGQETTITWDVNKATISSVGVKLSIDDGLSWVQIANGSIDPSIAKELAWTPSDDQKSTTCKIQIYDYTDESIFGESGTFTIE